MIKKIISENREPKVALFWYIDGKFVGEEYSPRDPSLLQYGDYLQCPNDHIDVWDRLKVALNKKVDYDYYPRGRIMINTLIKKFVVVGDPCLMTSKIKNQMIDYYDLPRSTIFRTDEHYTCHMCDRSMNDIDY